jgi:hypothetical protein
MVVSLVIVDVVNIKQNLVGWAMLAAFLTDAIVPLANFALELFRIPGFTDIRLEALASPLRSR